MILLIFHVELLQQSCRVMNKIFSEQKKSTCEYVYEKDRRKNSNFIKNNVNRKSNCDEIPK